MKIQNDFKKYALDKGISSMKLHYHQKQIEDNMTPYILEERELRVTQMDVFSRLLRDRIIWLSGAINQHTCDIVQAQLMFLDSTDSKDITIHINSPGGSVIHGLGIIDVMKYISCDVSTVNTGLAASMGSVLLSSGTKGKRSSLRFSRVMLHQVSHGTEGNIQDTRINQLEAEKYNYILFKLLAENCGKDYKDIIEYARRDRWYNSDEALKFGLIDEIIGSKSQESMTNLLKGFDEYYQKEVF
jgi:ATP-dependent Clp protease protease subunit